MCRATICSALGTGETFAAVVAHPMLPARNDRQMWEWERSEADGRFIHSSISGRRSSLRAILRWRRMAGNARCKTITANLSLAIFFGFFATGAARRDIGPANGSSPVIATRQLADRAVLVVGQRRTDASHLGTRCGVYRTTTRSRSWSPSPIWGRLIRSQPVVAWICDHRNSIREADRTVK